MDAIMIRQTDDAKMISLILIDLPHKSKIIIIIIMPANKYKEKKCCCDFIGLKQMKQEYLSHK